MSALPGLRGKKTANDGSALSGDDAIAFTGLRGEKVNIFEIPRYRWWEYMDPVMQNVNLSGISFLRSNHMEFTFLDSYDGKFHKKLSCDQIIKCCIDNQLENDVFAYFVPDIFLYKLSGAELESSLSYYKYGYNVDLSVLSDQYLVVIVGSELCIDVICGSATME